MEEDQVRRVVAIRIVGVVQGVFFRASCGQVASGLGLTGLVRNEVDGSVYVEVEGKKRDLDEFVDWCRRGPRHARVEKVTVDEIKSLSQPVEEGEFVIL